MISTRGEAPAKPRLALALATGLGLGYLPKAPGTWGSLLGALLGWSALELGRRRFETQLAGPHWDAALAAKAFAWNEGLLVLIVSLAGWWAAGGAAHFFQKKDPQRVVVDEIAGQLITYLGLATPRTFSPGWKYLLLGFILFRVFDIWKPFPARQAENLPGGLGIMADDWIAGVYAALALGVARYWLL